MKNKRPAAKPKARPGKRIIIILTVFIVYLVFIAVAAVLVDARTVRFYMEGEEETSLEHGTDYVESGVFAVTTGKLFGESKPLPGLVTEGRVDSKRLGSYTITYRQRWLFWEYSTSRKVTVVDTTPPVIELKHIDGYEPTWLSGYQEEGFTAFDSCDGDLTAKVLREELEDRIIYTVSDASGNSARAEREIVYAATPPTISIIGDKDLVFTARQYYQDPGCTAADYLGNDLTQLVFVENEVIPYQAGEYTVTYSISSDNGDIISETRHVTVIPANRPENVTPDTPTIYLTFDDGPGPYTGRLLDILAAYNVKATFFVTAAYPKYYDMIGRAYNEGHSVGVHTYSHNYNSIYSGEEAFFEDFNKMEELIAQQTGEISYISRFPGGSSNTVSRFNPGIMSRLSAALTDMGYKYFDWNVSSGDAGETTETSKVVENIINGCSGRKVSVVLQHDIKDFSVAAVEDVIIWGLSNGYTFCALDMSSPDAHHGINN